MRSQAERRNVASEVGVGRLVCTRTGLRCALLSFVTLACYAVPPATATSGAETEAESEGQPDEPTGLIVDDDISTSIPEAFGPSRRQLVLQGGHVLLIHDVAVHPSGRWVALLSIDMPARGQVLTPPSPYATVTLLEPATGLVRGSWRVVAGFQEQDARLRFSAELLALEGLWPRTWDLRTGHGRPLPFHEYGWGVLDPRAEGMFVVTDERLGLQRFDGSHAWSVALDGLEESRELDRLAVHPGGDQLAVTNTSAIHLFDRHGAALARAELPAWQLAFRARGGALYSNLEDSFVEVLDPRSLRRLGTTQWRQSLAESRDGELVLGRFDDDDQPALFDVRTGTLRWPLELHARQSDARSDGNYAFTWDGSHVWGCWYAETEVDQAPPELVIAPGRSGDDVIEYLLCVRHDQRGRIAQTLYLPQVGEREYGWSGPVGPSDTVPLAVDADERLIIASLADVYVVGKQGELLHHVDSSPIEAIVTGAFEAPDGSGVALTSHVALGWWSRAGASALVCPGILDEETRLRFAGSQPILYSQRYECPALASKPRQHEAILGVSRDGKTLALADGDLWEGEGRVFLRTPTRRRLNLPIRDAWCAPDGCAPTLSFSPDDRWILADEKLLDANTGRLVRVGSWDDNIATFSLDATSVAWTEWRRDEQLEIGVEDIRTGKQLASYVAEPDGPIYGRHEVVFAEGTRVLLRTGTKLILFADGLPDPRWVRELGGIQEVHVLGDRLLVIESGVAHLWTLGDGRPLVEPWSIGSGAALDSARSRIAWCADGKLWSLELGASGPPTTPARLLGSCVGPVIHFGERFAVSADGSLARVVRLFDGAGLWLRLVIEPYQRAFTIAESDAGDWWIDEEAFAHFRLREAGPVTSAPMSELTLASPGYDQQLIARFFAAPP